MLYNIPENLLKDAEKMLFENEIFNFSKINNVIYYKPKHLSKYKGKLPTYELTYYIEGESVISFNGKKYELTENSVFYLPKGVLKTYTLL